ncbi:NtaA/DmoA family FMN-dependent monooxygenase [Kineococcus rhizosphaerae]|nr:NtaA/DmoA family FMN-dependent monooxygenase [Kineococcus rhizosphaerae]
MILTAMVFYPGGEHLTSWRLPGGRPADYVTFEYYEHFARTAERAGFAALFYADELYVWDRFASGVEHVANVRPEPFGLLGALTRSTERIGLVATVSTTYNEPFHTARQVGSLDFLSSGRAGWNLVTSASDEEARNFGLERNLDHAARYRRGAEFVEVVTGLWDSWDDGAIRPDVASGRYADPAGLHVLGHEGEFFRVRGPLNLPRPPQGRPVLFQAGSSEDGRALAGRYAEAVFVPGSAPLPGAQRLYEDYKQRAVANGRAREHLLVLPALSPVLGETPARALEKLEEIEALTPDRLSLDWLSHHLGVDLSDRPLDERFEFDFTGGSNQVQTVFEGVRKLMDRERFTLRELYRTMLRRRFLPGTPEQVADWMTERFTHGAADGFTLAFSSLPAGLEEFAETVVPLLVARGVLAAELPAATLRENLGLPVPPSRYR